MAILSKMDLFAEFIGMFIILVLPRTCLSKVSAIFVFGDSLVEVGNNNYIPTLSRANYLPNGIDFGKPTGRFTNGRTIVDIIGQEAGFEVFPPPYLAPTTKGHVILKGVNYASGGAGILNETGYIFVGRINMDAQLDNFENTRNDITSLIGESAANDLLHTALFSVTMGSNDFINNYLTPVLSAPKQTSVPPEVFVASVIGKFRQQLIRLYNLGARKIIVANVGPIGCIPYERDTHPLAGADCASKPNLMARLFNPKLTGLVQEMNLKLIGSTFLYADVYRIMEDLLENYKSYGFAVANSACCYVEGNHGGLVPCGPPSRVCPNRSKFVFWDPYHPSEAANLVMVKRLMDGNLAEISPMNVRQLINL
ncbi:hypothetical protein ACFE04_007276 [Oxalis oulophora]